MGKRGFLVDDTVEHLFLGVPWEWALQGQEVSWGLHLSPCPPSSHPQAWVQDSPRPPASHRAAHPVPTSPRPVCRHPGSAPQGPRTPGCHRRCSSGPRSQSLQDISPQACSSVHPGTARATQCARAWLSWHQVWRGNSIGPARLQAKVVQSGCRPRGSRARAIQVGKEGSVPKLS